MTITAGAQIFSKTVGGKGSGGKMKTGVRRWLAKSWRPVFAEFVATTLLLLLGCMPCIPIEGFPEPQPFFTQLAYSFIVLFNTQVFGPLSGAQMNPASTLASVLWGKLTIPLGIAYALAQCTGAILGYGILMTVSPVILSTEGVCVTAPLATLTPWQVVGIEVALTTALNFMNCSLWDEINAGMMDSIPIKFGLAIAGFSMAGGLLSGASSNPARSLAPAVWTGVWTMHWVYWVGPFIGSAIAVVMYKYIWLNMHKTEEQTY